MKKKEKKHEMPKEMAKKMKEERVVFGMAKPMKKASGRGR